MVDLDAGIHRQPRKRHDERHPEQQFEAVSVTVEEDAHRRRNGHRQVV